MPPLASAATTTTGGGGSSFGAAPPPPPLDERAPPSAWPPPPERTQALRPDYGSKRGLCDCDCEYAAEANLARSDEDDGTGAKLPPPAAPASQPASRQSALVWATNGGPAHTELGPELSAWLASRMFELVVDVAFGQNDLRASGEDERCVLAMCRRIRSSGGRRN